MKKGDKVEILSNKPKEFAHINPWYGTIVDVDGHYVLVRPKYQRWEGEWYKNELRLIKK
jgi:hypothetical protein